MQAGSSDRVDPRLAADVAGYSRLMEADEAGTARMLCDYRAAAAQHGGGSSRPLATAKLRSTAPLGAGAVEAVIILDLR